MCVSISSTYQQYFVLKNISFFIEDTLNWRLLLDTLFSNHITLNILLLLYMIS